MSILSHGTIHSNSLIRHGVNNVKLLFVLITHYRLNFRCSFSDMACDITITLLDLITVMYVYDIDIIQYR